MGIRFTCPNGHKLHVKAFLAGKRGVCPHCGAKTIIPLEAEAAMWQSTAAMADPQRAAGVGSSVELAGVPIDAASPSMVIAVVDTPIAQGPVAEASLPVSPAAYQVTPPPTVSQPAATAQTFVFPNATEPAPTAARYVARRERHRRNQFVFAVILLVAVIVLAAVLVLVLQRGAGAAAVTKTASISCERTSLQYVAKLVGPCFNAHRALVANS